MYKKYKKVSKYYVSDFNFRMSILKNQKIFMFGLARFSKKIEQFFSQSITTSNK